MTQELELLFETKIDAVAKNMSSIFSKEDVVIMLKTLRQSIDELPSNKVLGHNYNKEFILTQVRELLDEYSFEEFVSCEPELNGSYGDSYSLEMNTSFDDREFKRSFLSELEDYFTPVN